MRLLHASLIVIGSCLAVPVFASGCTSSPESMCDEACDCIGCTQSERDDCVDNFEDGARIADDAGCSGAYDDLVGCYSSELECREDKLDLDGCEPELEALSSCMGTTVVTPFGDACKIATDRLIARFESCGIDVNGGEPEEVECTDQLATQTACFADCADATACGGLDGSDPDASTDFSNCINFCFEG